MDSFELTCASEGTSESSRASTVIPDDMGLASVVYAFDERLDHLAYPRCCNAQSSRLNMFSHGFFLIDTEQALKYRKGNTSERRAGH